MRTLEGGCSVPLGVETTYDEHSHKLVLKGIVISVDASECVEDEVQGLVETDSDAEELGKQLAEKLIEKGAKKILDEIHFADS
jgi:hydroxymethylbilane synthase